MPSIHIMTNATIHKPNELRAALEEVFDTVLGKPKEWVMVAMEDDARIYFGGNGEPCVMARVDLLGSVSEKDYAALTAAFCQAVEAELQIPMRRIYVTYTEHDYWGWNGGNF